MTVPDQIHDKIARWVASNRDAAVRLNETYEARPKGITAALVRLGAISRTDASAFLGFDIGHEIVLPERARSDHR